MKKTIIILTIVIMAIASFGQTDSTVTCRIWKTKSFCTLPDGVNVPGAIHYSNTHMIGIPCQNLDKNDSLVGVWVTFQGKNASELHMKSHYENISLVLKKTGRAIHPVAYMERSKPIHKEGDPEYAHKSSTAAEYYFELVPRGKYDLFIIFNTANVGDKLIIANFLEAEIKE